MSPSDCVFAEVEPPFKEESITDEEMMLYFAQEHDNSFHPKEFDDDDAEFVDFIFSVYGTTSLDEEEEEPVASVVDNFSTFQQVAYSPADWKVLRKIPRYTEGHHVKILLQQIGAIRGSLIPNYQEPGMTDRTSEPFTFTTQSPGHPLRLTFGDEEGGDKGKDKGKGPVEEVDEDLKKPYKEVLKSPFTRRIIEFSAPSHRMPTNLKIYDGSTDPDDHITRFVGAANQGEWEMPKFVERFALRRRCSKDPTEVSKIVRRANETLPDFKERWTEEMRYIQGVPEVMQISAFMSNSKCPELARHFADQVPQTVTEMMKRVDDFVKSEEAYKSTELP
ncbi:hypothetical protein Tco_0487146 [Tanacetum coccineum]